MKLKERCIEMSAISDFLVEAINTGLGMMFKMSPVNADIAAKSMITGGRVLIEIGEKLQDGKLDQAEIDDILDHLKSLDNVVLVEAIKSFVNRIVGGLL